MMKSCYSTIGGLLLIGLLSFTSCDPPAPIQWPEIPVETVRPYFNEVSEIQTIDTSYYQIKDAKGNVLGTLLYSMPYSATVHGYNGITPLLITLDADNRITNVVLMDHRETPRFAQRVEQGGLYQAWKGLSVDEALSKDVDAVSGATYTSNGVKNSLVVRLQAYQRQLAKDHSAQKPSFWQRLFGK